MSKWKKWITSPATSMVTFVFAVVLLLTSTVGGARAALTYYSETYATRVQMYDIGVSLLENEQRVSWRDYQRNSDGVWSENTGRLLANMLSDGESLQIGKQYREELCVKNSGTIHQYVRVMVYKYWTDAQGNKLQNLSPDLIDLHFVNLDRDWLLDETASTAERTVLYYNKLLHADETTPLFADTLTIDGTVATKVTQQVTTEGGYTTIRTSYDYNGIQFWIEATVDAVQEHNAEDAICSAWGRKVIVANQTLQLQ